MSENSTRHIVVLGAGFGGLTFCQKFHHPNARVTLVDRTNHHLFQPLLYQVATAGVSAPEIAQPIRSILSNRPDVTVFLDRVLDFDLAGRRVMLEKATLDYDYLVLALGGCTSYFGHPEWEQFAPGLKSLEDAIRIRHEVLLAFEKAECESDAAARQRLMTIVIVGGGPTGVELAGAFAELCRIVLRRDFRRIDPGKARVILIEASPVVLSHMPDELAASAMEQLRELGVQVRTSTRVQSITASRVELDSGEIIESETVIWAAGVSASPLTKKLGVELDRAGRVKVQPDLSLPGHPEVFAIGDMALVLRENGQPVPGVSPAAIQEARHVARLIEDELAAPGARQFGVPASAGSVAPAAPGAAPPEGGTPNVPGGAPRPAFEYWDKGTMATIGRSAAVACAGPLHLTGFPAWVAWLFVHLIFLIGFRNKLAVLLQWAYSYFTYKRGARIITSLAEK